MPVARTARPSPKPPPVPILMRNTRSPTPAPTRMTRTYRPTHAPTKPTGTVMTYPPTAGAHMNSNHHPTGGGYGMVAVVSSPSKPRVIKTYPPTGSNHHNNQMMNTNTGHNNRGYGNTNGKQSNGGYGNTNGKGTQSPVICSICFTHIGAWQNVATPISWRTHRVSSPTNCLL